MRILRVNILGVWFDAMDLHVATEAILEALRARRKGYVCATCLHGVSQAQRDPSFGQILNESFLNTMDGMPIVWLGKHYVGSHVKRVCGPDLLLQILQATRNTTFGHFFYGGAPAVADDLRYKMESLFPGIRIIGTYCPPFRPLNGVEEDRLEAMIAHDKPDIMWVCLGSPKQERFMAKYLPRLDTTLMIGVGAAFNFHVGRVPRAPRWMQHAGFEWFFRICHERGLAQRCLANYPLFVYRIALQLLGLTHHENRRACRVFPLRDAQPEFSR